jgi:hypothetical protein
VDALLTFIQVERSIVRWTTRRSSAG